jgi:hypothetical protein
MADIRTLGTSCEEYSIDNNVYPTLASIAALAGVVEPVYIRKAPQNDGWGRPFGVASVSGEYTICSICSGGKDGGNCTGDAGGATQLFDDSITFSGGVFVQWPEGMQQ